MHIAVENHQGYRVQAQADRMREKIMKAKAEKRALPCSPERASVIS